LLKDGVVDAVNNTGPSGRLYAVCEAANGYYAVGNFDGKGIIVKIDKSTLDHQYATFVAGSNPGSRMGDILDVSGQYLVVSAWSGGERWLIIFDYNLNILNQEVLPSVGVDERMEAIKYEIDGGTLSIYFTGKEVVFVDGAFGSYRRSDSDIRVGKVEYNHQAGTFTYYSGSTHNSINQGMKDFEVIDVGDVDDRLDGTIFKEYPPNNKVDHYPYGPMYINFPFERTFVNCSESVPLANLEFVEDWSDGSDDEPYSMELTSNYIVVSALLNKLTMWDMNNDNLGGDADGGLRCNANSCSDFDSDYYLWGEGYLLFFDKNDPNLPLHHAVHLGTFSGGDFNPRMVKTPDGGFAIVGTVTGCPDGEPEVSGAEHIMVIQTDSEGNILWRKHFNGQGEGACGFGITVTPDGGLLVVGNTEGDGQEGEENFCFIKLGSDCDYAADVTPNNDRDYVLPNDEVWNTDRTVNARVVVPAGRRLTISGTSTAPVTIRFADSREVYDFNNPAPIGILVQAGGLLYISYATLTGWDCGQPKMWDGINIEGQPGLPQTITNQSTSSIGNQGYCRIVYSTIENARAGVIADAAWTGTFPPVITTFAGTGSQSTMQTSTYYHGADRGGAKIESFYSNFLNNRRGAIFMRYPHNWNTSKFWGTNFINNAPLVDPSMIAQSAPNIYNDNEPLGTSIHASIWSTRVSFSSCHFTGPSSFANAFKPIGIGGYDARIVSSGGDMTDLKIGIESATATGGLLANVIAVGTTFDKCVQGITLRNSAVDRIQNCVFTNIPESSLVQGMSPCGIFGQFCGATTVLNNDFTGSGGKSIGVVMHNTGGNGADIRENEFFSSRFGNQFEGNNLELIARCNDYTNHDESAWSVVIDDNGNQGLHDQGIGPFIGQQKADNEFFDNCTGFSDNHIYAEFAFDYYDKTGNMNHAEPDCVSDVVNFGFISDGSLIGCAVIDDPCDPPCDRKEQYFASQKTLWDRNRALQGLIHTGADSEDNLNPSRYDDVMDILLDRNQAEDRMLLVGTLYAQGDYTAAQSELNSLQGTTTQINAYRDYMSNLLASESQVVDMPDAYYQTALDFLEEDGTSARAMAQNLHFLREAVYYPLEAIEPSSSRPAEGVSSTKSNQDKLAAWAITPNPFISQIQFRALSATGQSASVEVFNALGQKVWSAQIQSGNQVTWNFADGIPGGTYYYFIRSADGATQTGKIVNLKH